MLLEINGGELITFAEAEGISWAEHELTLSFKLEWIHALRRTLWHLLHKFYPLSSSSEDRDFFKLEKKVNDGIDEFLNNFFISYSEYKDELFLKQRQLVEHLTVPIIPVSSTVAVLPLIGEFDSYRIDIMKNKILNEIARLGVEVLIIDVSGVPDIDEYTINKFRNVLCGVNLMGSRSVLTGLRPLLAKKIVHLGINNELWIEVKGTLQQALNEYLVIESY